MKVVGIIVEYNPFHNGHLYHLEQVKHMSNADLIIAVMSGNFTQRGEFAIIDKFKRAELALVHGVDLVIELPYCFATASADLFSYHAVKLLNELQVEEIYFGSESNNLERLTKIAQCLDTPECNHQIKHYLEQGYSYPKACELGLKHFLPHTAILSNDLLGIQYIRSINQINPSIKYFLIKRQGNHYLDEDLPMLPLASATSIRKAVKQGQDVSRYVPNLTLKFLQESTVYWDQYYPYLIYQIKLNKDHLNHFHDCPPDLAKRIARTIPGPDFATFVKQLSTRRYTESKIRRVLLHILMNFKTEDFINEPKEYIRILGLRKSKSHLLKEVFKKTNYPIITNITRSNIHYLKTENRVDRIYYLHTANMERKIPIICD